MESVAYVLKELGTEKAWVVHGSDGLDELTTTGATTIAVLEHGHVSHHTVEPEDAGLKPSTLAALKGGTAEENAEAIRELFKGARNAYRDIVLLNSAAALVVVDKAETLRDGVALAAAAIDTGRAAETLHRCAVPNLVLSS